MGSPNTSLPFTFAVLLELIGSAPCAAPGWRFLLPRPGKAFPTRHRPPPAQLAPARLRAFFFFLFFSSFSPFSPVFPFCGPGPAPRGGMSSGLADAAVLAPLKPVSMSGDPHEDTPVFEDIKTPSRALENPPDLAQVRAGTGPFLPLRCAEPPQTSAFGLGSALLFFCFLFFAATPPWLCRLPLPPPLGFLLGVLGFVWEFWFGFFFASCVPSNLPGGLCSHPRAQSLSPGVGRPGCVQGFSHWEGFWDLDCVLDGKQDFIFHLTSFSVFLCHHGGEGMLLEIPWQHSPEIKTWIWDVLQAHPGCGDEALSATSRSCSLFRVGSRVRQAQPHPGAVVSPFSRSVGCGVLG